MGGHICRAYWLQVPAVPLSTKRLQLKGCAETLAYTGFPQEHWRRIRANNAIERTNREIRRRTRVVGTFPDGRSALMLVTARLKYVAESEWGVAPLSGRVAAGRVAVPDGGPPTCQKVRKKLDGTQLACDSPVGQLLKLAALRRTPEQSL